MGDTMKIGVFAVLFGDKPFEETLDYLHSLGVQAVEIGTGAYPGDAHCRPSALRAPRQSEEAECVPRGGRQPRDDHQRAELPR
jgi:sugar phosphate isomerase/epimerase